jgi:hypothetical protein
MARVLSGTIVLGIAEKSNHARPSPSHTASVDCENVGQSPKSGGMSLQTAYRLPRVRPVST